MLEKGDKHRTIVFRSHLALHDSQAFSKNSSKPSTGKARKPQPESDAVEDAFFRLADRMGEQTSSPAWLAHQRDAHPLSPAAEKLWKELQLHSERAKENARSSRSKKAIAKSLRKTRSGETRKKAA